MGVSVERKRNGGMSQKLLNLFWVHILLQQDSCRCVAKIMESDMRDRKSVKNAVVMPE